MKIDKTLRVQQEVPKSVDAKIYQMIWSSKKTRSNFRIWKTAGVFWVLAVCVFGGYRYYDDYQTTNQYNQTISSIDTTLSDLENIWIQW